MRRKQKEERDKIKIKSIQGPGPYTSRRYLSKTFPIEKTIQQNQN